MSAKDLLNEILRKIKCSMTHESREKRMQNARKTPLQKNLRHHAAGAASSAGFDGGQVRIEQFGLGFKDF